MVMREYSVIAGLLLLLAGRVAAQSTIVINGQQMASASTLGVISPMDFGCAGDGSADDTICFGKALMASVGKSLALGPHNYLVNPVSAWAPSGPVQIVGLGGAYGGTPASQITAGTHNLSLFTLAGNSAITGVYIDMTDNGRFTNGSGTVVNMLGGSASPTGIRVAYDFIHGACNGIVVNGSLHLIAYNTVDVKGSTSSSCAPITIGSGTTAATSVDNSLIGNNFDGETGTLADLIIYDSGGLFLNNNNVQFGIDGTHITPGLIANQVVQATTSSGNYFGDTIGGSGLVIDTLAPSAIVNGLQSGSDWVASGTGASPLLFAKNTHSGTVSGLYFTGLRVVGSGGDGIEEQAGVTDLQLNGANVCGFAAAGIRLDRGAGSTQIVGGKISPSCNHQSGFTGTVGIAFGGSNADMVICDVDLVGSGSGWAPVNLTGPTGNSVVCPSPGLDTAEPTATVTSNGITLDARPNWLLSTATAINVINGAWNGRLIRLVTNGGATAFTTNVGTNICAPFTSAGTGAVVEGQYDGVSNCWHLK